MNGITIFADIGKEVNSILTLMMAMQSAVWATQLLMVAKVSISLYVVVYGYMVLAGKIQTPVHDLVWTLARWAIILAFLQNAGGLLVDSHSAVDGIKSFFLRGENAYSLLDKKLDQIAVLATKIWTEADGIEETLFAILRLVGMVPMLLGFLAVAGVTVFTEITLKILFATAPIFIFCLMFGFLRDSFNSWLSAIIGNCLILLFVSVTMDLTFAIATDALTNSGKSKGTIVPMILLLISGVMSMMTVKWGREMALALARVSVDSAIGGQKDINSIRSSINRGGNTIRQGYQAVKNFANTGKRS